MPAADPTIRLGVLGLGTVGAPVATLATKRGWPTVGFDPDPIARQTPEHALPDAADLLLTAEPIDLSGCTVFVICVPTPAQAGATDLRALETACSTIAEQLQPGHVPDARRRPARGVRTAPRD